MTTYYLQKTSSRQIIDTKSHSTYELQDTTEATSWIQAKQQFGFPLTSLQEYILDQQ